MKKNIIYRSLLVIITITLFSCEDWLDKHPYDVVSSDEVWTDISTAEGVLANLYDRLNTSPFDKANMQLTDEAMWSGDRAGLKCYTIAERSVNQRKCHINKCGWIHL